MLDKTYTIQLINDEDHHQTETLNFTVRYDAETRTASLSVFMEYESDEGSSRDEPIIFAPVDAGMLRQVAKQFAFAAKFCEMQAAAKAWGGKPDAPQVIGVPLLTKD
jgi:hypothetical protein